MNFIKSTCVVFVFILGGVLSSPKIHAATSAVLFKIQNQLATSPLTKESVRRYIKTSIAITKLQLKMRDQSGDGNEVIKEFYQKRKVLLESRGWTVEDFENTRDRIFAVQYAMEQQNHLKSNEEFEQEIAEIKANAYFSAEQKSQVIELKRQYRNRVLEEVIEPTKPDWPAVEAYQKELEHLDDYVAENRSDPPVVE